MGRAMRAGVRVGLFVCLCLCRERPPCEGFIPSVTAEGSEVRGENLGFPGCVACPPWRDGQGHVTSGVSTFVQKEAETRRNGGFQTSSSILR